MTHTPGPWKVVADPILKGFHPLHDNRYVMTSNAKIEQYTRNDGSETETRWNLSEGYIICKLRDTENQAGDARLIAAAPELLGACKKLVHSYGKDSDDTLKELFNIIEIDVKAAIAKAEGRE